MKKTINVILIDPAARTVALAESSGTLEHLQQLVQTDYLEPARVSGTDMLLFAEDPKPGLMPFKIGPKLVIRGRAVVAGDGDVTFDSPKITVDAVRELVTFPPSCFTPK